MFTLDITPLGDPDRAVHSLHETKDEALAAVAAFAGAAYRVNFNPSPTPDARYRYTGGTLTSPTGSGVHQASYAFNIR